MFLAFFVYFLPKNVFYSLSTKRWSRLRKWSLLHGLNRKRREPVDCTPSQKWLLPHRIPNRRWAQFYGLTVTDNYNFVVQFIILHRMVNRCDVIIHLDCCLWTKCRTEYVTVGSWYVGWRKLYFSVRFIFVFISAYFQTASNQLKAPVAPESIAIAGVPETGVNTTEYTEIQPMKARTSHYIKVSSSHCLDHTDWLTYKLYSCPCNVVTSFAFAYFCRLSRLRRI